MRPAEPAIETLALENLILPPLAARLERALELASASRAVEALGDIANLADEAAVLARAGALLRIDNGAAR